MKHRSTILFVVLSILLVLLFILDLVMGSVQIPFKAVLGALLGGEVEAATSIIVLDIRLTKAIVAVLAGVALSVSGLQMQTLLQK